MSKRINLAEVFTRLYETNFWGGEESPESGSGSTKTAALPYVTSVKSFIQNNSIKKVLDIGHGDWEMWDDYKFENVDYVGIDVYEKMTIKLETTIGNNHRKFLTMNAITQNLPVADLCISKDVLQHLPLKDIKAILYKLKEYKYIIICNDFYKFRFYEAAKALRRFISIRERISMISSRKNPLFLKLRKTNSDIKIGEHRCLNLEAKMFTKSLSNHKLLFTRDLDGKDIKRPAIVKRIYFYEKL